MPTPYLASVTFCVLILNALTLTACPDCRLELLWQKRVTPPVFSSPVTDGTTLLVGDSGGRLHAFSTTGGDELWRFSTGAPIRSGVEISSGRVFLNGGNGTLYALSKKGALLWKYQSGPETRRDFADYFNAVPVADTIENRVFFGTSSGLSALSADRGSVLWKFKTGASVHHKPVFDSTKVYFGTFDGHFYAVDKQSGKQAWTFKTVGHRYFPKGEIQGSPVLAGDAVVFGARDYNVYALNRSTGTGLWTKSHRRGWVHGIAADAGTLYLAGADERILEAVEAASGQTIWLRPMGFLQFSPPAVHGSFLIHGTTIGKLYLRKRADGAAVDSFLTPEYINNRSTYFKENDTYRDDIYSIITSNEQFLDVQIQLGGFFTSVAVHNDTLFAVSSSGTVYAFRVRHTAE
jgi:outer membrane protein assembly factor BamB